MREAVAAGPNRRVLAAMVVLLFAGVVMWVAPAVQAVNPPGNNGTVKIDGVAFGNHPNNEPHVGCMFEVDFYGFDEGDLDAIVTFKVQPPTGQFVQILTDTVFIGEDDNSGGGSQAGLDASELYDLSDELAGFPQHPQQGWHVKLTVNAEGSKGADVKHKVFWVSGCVRPTTTSTTHASTTTTHATTTTTCPPKTTTTTKTPY